MKGLTRVIGKGVYECYYCGNTVFGEPNTSPFCNCGTHFPMNEQTSTEMRCECGKWLNRHISHCVGCQRSNYLYVLDHPSTGVGDI